MCWLLSSTSIISKMPYIFGCLLLPMRAITFHGYAVCVCAVHCAKCVRKGCGQRFDKATHPTRSYRIIHFYVFISFFLLFFCVVRFCLPFLFANKWKNHLADEEVMTPMRDCCSQSPSVCIMQGQTEIAVGVMTTFFTIVQMRKCDVFLMMTCFWSTRFPSAATSNQQTLVSVSLSLSVFIHAHFS